jgi:hypothetical protein
MALIQCIDKQLEWNTWYPNDTISYDWDVLQATVNTLLIFLRPPLVSLVKGHQDNNMAYALLPLEAQLNLDVDAVTMLFQTDHGATRYLVPIIEGNTAQLILNGKMVTYGYVKMIRNAYADPLLGRYIGKCNQWSESELSTIYWMSLGARAIITTPKDILSFNSLTICSQHKKELKSTTRIA